MTRKGVYAFITVFLALMTACSGSIKGVVREDARRVPFEYSVFDAWDFHNYLYIQSIV